MEKATGNPRLSFLPHDMGIFNFNPALKHFKREVVS